MNTSNVAALSRNVAQRRGIDVMRLMDTLRDETAIELGAAVSGVSIRRIVAANVPGASAYGLSRGINGSDSNPLFRLTALLVLMKRLGMGRAKAQRLVDYLQALVDLIWPAEEEQKTEQKTEAEAGSAR